MTRAGQVAECARRNNNARRAGTQETWRKLHLIGALLSAALVAACHKSGPAGSPAAGTPATPAPPGATLAIAGQLLAGDDPAALRSYLQSVKEIKPKTFSVEWNPATVAVGREEAIRALQGISRDGSMYTFTASEPVVGKIKAGSILWIWDVAVRRVDRVQTTGDRTVVHTQPVALTEALKNARIEFDSGVSASDYYMAWRPHRAPPPAPAKTARLQRAGFYLVGFKSSGPNASPPEPNGEGESGDQGDGSAGGDESNDWGEGAPASNGFNGTLKGFNYSLQYDTRPSGLSLTLQARKEDEGGEGAEGGKAGGEADGSDKLKEKFEEIDKEKQESKKEIDEAKRQLEEERKDLKTLDSDYERDLSKLKADQAARKNPDFQGPKPPRPKTDSNGTPLTDQAEQDLLTKNYERQRAVETAKLAEVQRIHDEARKKSEEADAQRKALKKMALDVAAKLFEIASENLDVRFRVRADLDNFDVSGAMAISNGDLDAASAQFKNLKGHVAVSFIGRLGQPGTGAVKIPLMDVPIAFNIPFPVGGIPFVIQVGTDFNINVFLSGQHAAMKFDGSYDFSGSGGFHSDKSGSESDSHISGAEPEVADYQAMSPGVSAAVLGIQVPRLGLGLGLLGASSVTYIDVVHVMTITNSASVALGMLAPPCKRITYAAVGHVGVDTNIMPLPVPFIANAVNKKLSPKKELFNYQKEVLDPPMKACEVH